MRNLILLLALLISALATNAQNYTISGYITDETDGETLIGASVFDKISKKGNAANNFGYYSITLSKGDVSLEYSFVGYTSRLFEFALQNDTDDFFGIEGQSNGYDIFTDVLFNGSTYNLTFTDRNLKEVKFLPQYVEFEHRYSFPDRVVYHIEVQQLTYEYFMYLKTRNAYNNNDDNPFMEPIQIFSNIENGTGILGSAAITKRVVEVE
jgi:hypothetical protein